MLAILCQITGALIRMEQRLVQLQLLGYQGPKPKSVAAIGAGPFMVATPKIKEWLLQEFLMNVQLIWLLLLTTRMITEAAEKRTKTRCA